MLAMMLASENIAFSAALLLMLMIALLEGVGMLFGLGISNLLESVLPEADFSPHAEVAQLDAQSALSRFLGRPASVEWTRAPVRRLMLLAAALRQGLMRRWLYGGRVSRFLSVIPCRTHIGWSMAGQKGKRLTALFVSLCRTSSRPWPRQRKDLNEPKHHRRRA